MGKCAAGRACFADKLHAITSELDDNWPFDLEQWKLEMAESYNSIKHANRADMAWFLFRPYSGAVCAAWFA